MSSLALTRAAAVRVTGLHAHTGSGIFDVANWTETGALLARAARGAFRTCAWSISAAASAFPSRSARAASISPALDAGVARLKRQFPQIEFWMEPGRFLVAKAGVLVAHGDAAEEQGRGRSTWASRRA